MRGLLAAVTGLALLTAGCSSDGEKPGTLPPISPSPTAATPLPTPSGINAPDAFGASAFAKYWFDVLSNALQVNDAGLLEELSDNGCDSCNNLIQAISKARREQRSTPDLRYELFFAEASPPEGGKAVVDASWRLTPSAEYDARGRVVATHPASDKLYGQLLLGRAEPSWVVLGFRMVAHPERS